MSKENKENKTEETKQPVPATDKTSASGQTLADDFSDVQGEEIVIVSGADYWSFENSKIFVGIPTGDYKHNEDGELIGIEFKSVDKKHDWLIPATHSIMEALQTNVPGTETMLLNAGYPVKIEFLGKIVLKNGRDFNKFKISVLKPI